MLSVLIQKRVCLSMVLAATFGLFLGGCSSMLCQAQTDKATDPLMKYEQQKQCEELVDQHIDNEIIKKRAENQQLLDESIKQNTH